VLCTFYSVLKETAAVHHCSSRIKLGIYQFISDSFWYPDIKFQYWSVLYFLFLRALSIIKRSILESHKTLRGSGLTVTLIHEFLDRLPEEVKQYHNLLCMYINLSGSAGLRWNPATELLCLDLSLLQFPPLEMVPAPSVSTDAAPNASAEPPQHPQPRHPQPGQPWGLGDQASSPSNPHGEGVCRLGVGAGPRKGREISDEKALAGNSLNRLRLAC